MVRISLHEAFNIDEATAKKYVIIVAHKHDYAYAYGPFSTEDSAQMWLDWRKKQGDDEAESLSYDDHNGDVTISELETPPARTMTGHIPKKP